MRFTAFPNEYFRSQAMSTPSKPFDQQNCPETELIHRLFSSDALDEASSLYPWNPAEPEAEAYYVAQEQQFSMDDWSEAELHQSATNFFNSLQACWPTQDVLQLLCDKFAARIPQEWLTKVAAEATKVATQQITAASKAKNQLASCVRELLPEWTEDDRLLLVRPYAFAMRGAPDAEDINKLVRPIDWSELSAMEQARLTVLATKYALEQFDKE
jgi:hypothetical protein